MRAVFGFPLHVGAVRLGALNLYRDRPGPLTDEQHADALVMADVAAQAVLVLQANAPPGQLAAELEAGADFQYVVHQAAGMVAVQLDVSVAQALIRLQGLRLRQRPSPRRRGSRRGGQNAAIRCAKRRERPPVVSADLGDAGRRQPTSHGCNIPLWRVS